MGFYDWKIGPVRPGIQMGRHAKPCVHGGRGGHGGDHPPGHGGPLRLRHPVPEYAVYCPKGAAAPLSLQGKRA